MAIDTEEKRRAALNALLVPWVNLPLPTGTINDEDRAMIHKVYFAGAFPALGEGGDKLVSIRTGITIS